jgi:hypothetical protein
VPWTHENDPERAAGAEWRDAGGIRVGLAPSAPAARQAALEECRRRQEEGGEVVLVAPDRATARSLREAGGVPTVVPRKAAAALDASPKAGLVVVGPAAALPSEIRRRAGVDRTHVIVQEPADASEGRVAEAALPPRLVRDIGGPPRSRDGRDAWRRTAALVVERDTARGVTTDIDLATARRDLARHRGHGRDHGLDQSLGR